MDFARRQRGTVRRTTRSPAPRSERVCVPCRSLFVERMLLVKTAWSNSTAVTNGSGSADMRHPRSRDARTAGWQHDCGVGSGDGLPTGLDLDGAVAAGGLDEFPDNPAGSRFDPPGDGEGGEDDGQVGLDGVALAVVDAPGLQVSDPRNQPRSNRGPTQAVPKDLDLHLVLDNYATHKTPKVKEWLLRHRGSICTSPRPVRPG